MFAELFSPQLPQAMMGSVVFVLLALVLFLVSWRVIDKITPGKLNKELCPDGPRDLNPPNVALAIVVGSMMLGMAVIIAAAIH